MLDQEQYSLENLQYFINNSKTSIDQYSNQKLINEQRIGVVSKELLTLGEVKKLLIMLKNSKMFEKKDFILNTINTALSDVFNDQNVRIDLVASNTNQEASKLNIKYDIVLYQNDVEMSRNEKLLNKNGGGVLSFISILFKILVGYIYSRNKFYVFDESLAEVSEIYLPRMGQFLQKFCKVHKFTIILITHTPSISEFADIAYSLDGEFENGVPTLRIDKIEGEYPKEDYVYSKIENFQSIKKLEFRYKGFTTITGKNNIGKSASFRAINSIIFNNFDIKDYPRFESAEKPDKLLNTRLEFGYFSKENDPENDIKKIGFYKKGQSIIWFFDGMEFVGKNLAGEKVKEKVEQIGFKYLKLKEQYKNFKGNLKDQTERLAITTQQDGYYLIGGKTSDTSKVFDFLFDSREVTLALIDLNADILNLENEVNKLARDNGEITFIISRTLKELKRFELAYKIKMIEQIKHLREVIEFNKDHYYQISQELEAINKIMVLADLIWKIEYESSVNESLNYKANTLNYFVSKVNNIILVSQKISLISQVINTSINHEQNVRKFNYFRNIIFVLDKIIINSTKRAGIENLMLTIESGSFLRNKYNFILGKFNLLERLLLNSSKIDSIQKLINGINDSINYKNKLIIANNYNTKCIEVLNSAIKKSGLENLLVTINSEYQKINKSHLLIDNLNKTLAALPNTFGLEPCKSCSTLGYTHIH